MLLLGGGLLACYLLLAVVQRTLYRDEISHIEQLVKARQSFGVAIIKYEIEQINVQIKELYI